MLAATMTSSCLQLFPAETALAVANVMGLVALMRSSGSVLDRGASFELKALISCAMASMLDSSARVPRLCSSSTAFTVFSSDVTFVTMI
jgi:hypothetical protein